MFWWPRGTDDIAPLTKKNIGRHKTLVKKVLVENIRNFVKILEEEKNARNFLRRRITKISENKLAKLENVLPLFSLILTELILYWVSDPIGSR